MSLKVYALKVKGKQRADTLCIEIFSPVFKSLMGWRCWKACRQRIFFFRQRIYASLDHSKNIEMAARAKYNVHFWNHTQKSFVLSRLKWLKLSFSAVCFCFGCHYLVWHPCQGNLFLISTVVFLLLLQRWMSRQDLDATYLNENWLPAYLWFQWREWGNMGSWWLARTCKADRCVPCLSNHLENEV